MEFQDITIARWGGGGGGRDTEALAPPSKFSLLISHQGKELRIYQVLNKQESVVFSDLSIISTTCINPHERNRVECVGGRQNGNGT